MRKFVVFLLFWAIVLTDFRWPSSGVAKSHGAGPLALAPVAAIGALEAAALTLTMAFAIGMISTSRNERYQVQISQMIEKIKTATTEMMSSAIEEASVLLKAVGTITKKGCPAPTNESKKFTTTCSANTPEACCGDFFKKFDGRIEKSRGGFRFFGNSKKSRILCCMEWDHIHGGFEIFDNNGRHLGERGCDDLNEDPCKYTETRGRHALPKSFNHHPRSGLCSP